MKITKSQLKQIIQEELLKEEHEPYTVGNLKNLANNLPDDYRVQVTYHGESLEIDEIYHIEEDKVVYITVR